MHCVKCGREIPEGEMFCAACRMPTVNPAPAPQKKVPVHKPTRAARKAEKAAARPPKAPRARGWILAFFLTLALLAAVCAAVFLRYDDFKKSEATLRVREANVKLREKEADNRDARIAELEEALKQAQAALEADERTIAELSAESIPTAAPKSELSSLKEENTNLLQNVKQLEEDNQTLRRQVLSVHLQNEILGTKSDFIDRYVVFVEDDGTKYYHRYGCPAFKKQTFWAYSRHLAEDAGYAPCPDCFG